MVHKAPLQFLVILLVFSFVLSSSAVPTTSKSSRRLLSKREDSSFKTTPDQVEAVEFSNGEERIDVGSEESMLERRMDIENSDYPGTGANNSHDPKSPGRA